MARTGTNTGTPFTSVERMRGKRILRGRKEFYQRKNFRGNKENSLRTSDYRQARHRRGLHVLVQHTGTPKDISFSHQKTFRDPFVRDWAHAPCDLRHFHAAGAACSLRSAASQPATLASSTPRRSTVTSPCASPTHVSSGVGLRCPSRTTPSLRTASARDGPAGSAPDPRQESTAAR